MNAAEQHLVDISLLMAQELQEIVDDADEAVEGGYYDEPMTATKELLKTWEAAYAACGFTEEDHFQDIRNAIASRTRQKEGT